MTVFIMGQQVHTGEMPPKTPCTDLCDVEGRETHSKDDQHSAQQLGGPPSPLPENIHIIHL